MEEKINETAVWNRVTAASREGSKTPESETGPIGPELLAAMERKQSAIVRYRQLVSRCNGEMQRVLRKILQQEQQQLRLFSALYYFLTGERPCLGQISMQNRRESIADSLRRMMQGEELSAGRLEALAARSTGEVREALADLCRQERQHFHWLLPLLGQSIES